MRRVALHRLVLVIRVLLVRVGLAALLDELDLRLLLAGDDARASVEERTVALGEALLELEDLALELGLDRRLIRLQALERVDALPDRQGQRLDVAWSSAGQTRAPTDRMSGSRATGDGC